MEVGSRRTSFFFASARALASAFASFFAVSFSSNACPSRLSVPIFACNASGRPLSDLDGHSPNCCHLRSSIGCRHQDVRPSATPCTWRTENRTRSIRAGRSILTMFSGLCRHLCWFSLTFAVEDIDRLDRLRSVRGGLVLRGCDRWGRGGWSLLISFLVWCHRERDRRRFVRRGYRSIPFPEVRPGLPRLRSGSRRGYSALLDPVLVCDAGVDTVGLCPAANRGAECSESGNDRRSRIECPSESRQSPTHRPHVLSTATFPRRVPPSCSRNPPPVFLPLD